MRVVDADGVWADAGPLIARALEGSDDTADEVLRSCRTGDACLLADNSAYCVLALTPHAGGMDLLVWVVVSRGPVNCLKTWLPHFEALARSLGVRRLAFRTAPRRAYERLMPEGWAVRQVIWAKEV